MLNEMTPMNFCFLKRTLAYVYIAVSIINITFLYALLLLYKNSIIDSMLTNVNDRFWIY